MEYTVKERDEAAEVFISGVLHSEEVKQLRGALLEVARRRRKIEFRLQEVASVDSSAIGLILAVRNQAVPAQGLVAVSGLQDRVRKIFELANLAQVIEIRTDKEIY